MGRPGYARGKPDFVSGDHSFGVEKNNKDTCEDNKNPRFEDRDYRKSGIGSRVRPAALGCALI